MHVPQDVREAYEASSVFFPTPLQQFQFYDKYSRFDYELGRRETWIETVDRSVGFLKHTAPDADKLLPGLWDKLRTAILTMGVMPSMRLLATAGPAAARNNLAIYNCSYMPVDSLEAFSEALLISMNGCGVGFSVEQQYVEQLPRIEPKRHKTLVVQIADTTEGWQEALYQTLRLAFEGYDVEWDTRQVRPAGTPLRTKGGVASGPEPFVKALSKIVEIIQGRRGTRTWCSGFLRPIDAYDIMCLVGNAAVSGGHRRTAMIALFDQGDKEMLNAKPNGFWEEDATPWRTNANNSVVWTGPITREAFDDQMEQLFAHGTGEPGIFSRYVANQLKPERRAAAEFGTNPCGEISLRPWQFCNLSAVVARKNDTRYTLREKVVLATVIGTIQSMLTHFPGLRPQWRQNCEEERLLGVDITGQRDCPLLEDADLLEDLRSLAVETNRKLAAILGINQSASVTCVKPSGNTSVLVDCASGLHARWGEYYLKNARISEHSPVFKTLVESGVLVEPENGKPGTWVVPFPIFAEGSVTRHQLTAIDQCEYWLHNKEHWTEHNPSVTITYRPEEVQDLIDWLWDHRDKLGGMSFLPFWDADMPQMPWEEMTREEAERRRAAFPDVDWSLIYWFEAGRDQTNAASTLACESDLCLVTAGA